MKSLNSVFVIFFIFYCSNAYSLNFSAPDSENRYFLRASDTITWDFEDSTFQNWTHTSAFSYPRAWGVQKYNSGYDTAFYCPAHGNYSMWIDSDAAGTSVVDTAISPPFIGAPGNYLKWGFCFDFYSGNDFLRVLLRTCNSNTWSSWNQVKNYTTAYNSDWDSVNLTPYTADSFQMAFVYAGNYDWYAAFDNVGPVIVNLPNYHDVGVYKILSPKENISPGSACLSAVVKNYGGFPENFNVRCIIEDSTSVVFDQTLSASTSVWGYDTVDFGNYNFQENCDYIIRTFTLLAGDAFPENDTLIREVFCREFWWEELSDMPVAKWGALSGWSIDNSGNTVIHVFGNASNIDSAEYRFNYTSKSWSGPYLVPVRVRWGASVSWMNKIYLFAHNSSSDSVQILNADDYSWRSGAPLFDSISSSVAVLAEDRGVVYVIGGYLNGVAVNTVQVYDIIADSFISGTQFPLLVAHGSAAYIGNDTIVFSTGYVHQVGDTNATFYGIINSSDPSQISWVQGPDYPSQGVSCAGYADWLDGLYVFGGRQGGSYINRCYAYLSNRGWITLPDKPTGRAYIAGCAAPVDISLSDSTHKGVIFAAGGYNPNSNCFEALHTYALSTYVEEKPVEYNGSFSIRLLSSNVFKTVLEIELALPYASSVSFKIHDVSGRLLREDFFGSLTQGIHRLCWEGKNSTGENVSPGVYFFSIEAGQGRYTGKIIFTE